MAPHLLETTVAADMIIPATKGFEIVVSGDDYERLSAFKWHAFSRPGRGYLPARREGAGRRRVVFLVREVLPPKEGFIVDHINGDPWDNRRENLRYCTDAENSRNRRKVCGASQFKGVRRHRASYQAKIVVDGRDIYLGSFAAETDAAEAYDEAARKYFGEFARLNFPTVAEQPALISAKVGNCHTISRPEIVTYGDVARIPQELAAGSKIRAGGKAGEGTDRRWTHAQNHGLALHDVASK